MRLLNFGSLNVDSVFQVESIVKPGQTISSSGLSVNCGGKGLNQSIAAANAGIEVFHAGAIGQEDTNLLKKLLDDNHVDTRFVSTNHQYSGKALIQCDKNGQNCIVLFGGANQEIEENYVDFVLESFTQEDILLIQNEISSIEYIIHQSKKKGMKICFNPSPVDEKLSNYPMELIDILILNEIEGEELTGEKEGNLILDCLLERYPQMEVVLTLGDKGSMYACKNYRITQDIYDVTVVDTTAAGDTFTGYYLAMSLKQGDKNLALKYASAASAIAVGISGASCSIPKFDEVEKFLKNRSR